MISVMSDGVMGCKQLVLKFVRVVISIHFQTPPDVYVPEYTLDNSHMNIRQRLISPQFQQRLYEEEVCKIVGFITVPGLFFFALKITSLPLLSNS